LSLGGGQIVSQPAKRLMWQMCQALGLSSP
jgi:hypothetical protein